MIIQNLTYTYSLKQTLRLSTNKSHLNICKVLKMIVWFSNVQECINTSWPNEVREDFNESVKRLNNWNSCRIKQIYSIIKAEQLKSWDTLETNQILRRF